jgi:hypothetical protein
MQTKFNQLALVLLILSTLLSLSSKAQISNGDFSNNTNNWRYFFLPSNVQIPAHGIMQVDIDGAGPLGSSPAFYANVGDDALMNLEQNIVLTAGVTYNFRANLSSIPYSFNADGGTISVFIGPTNIVSYSFGSFSSISPKYSTLAATFVPVSSGSQTLSIHFSRGYGAGGVGNTPTDVIDNIFLSPTLIPLKIQFNRPSVILTWTNSAYILQSAPSVLGPYTNVSGAGSPFTNSISAPGQYFRLTVSN